MAENSFADIDAIQREYKDCKNNNNNNNNNKHAVNRAMILFTQHLHYRCPFAL